MRIRSIHPEFWRSEDVGTLDWETRLLFIGLWSYVDDNGVGRNVPKLIQAELFPLEDDPRDTLATVSRGLQTLSDNGQITCYEAHGKPYLHVRAWSKWQKIDRPAKERYPLPDNALTSTNGKIRDTLATPSRQSRDTPATGEGEKGRRGEGEKGASRRAPETTLPDSWQPSDAHTTYSKTHTLDVAAEAFKFRNHAKANDRRQRDWNAAFTTWLARAREYAPARPVAKPRNPNLPEGW
jgi:hypothetical protein